MLTISDFIDQHRPEFIEFSVRRLKARYPERSEQDLETSLPVYLDDLIGALRIGDTPPQEKQETAEARHAAEIGSDRQRRGFDIATVAHTFGAISEALGELGQRAGVIFSPADYGTFNRCIDASIARAIESFHRGACMDAGQQAAKFVGFLAHELRNELWSARMSYSMIANGSIGMQSRTGAILARSLQHMESLISQTLAAVQLESDKPPELRRISVAALLDELQAAAFPGREVKLVIEADRSLEVIADERLFSSAINNLVQNALKFTCPGGRVEVRARREGDRAVIEVEDECGGLPPGKREELFRPFAQQSNNRSGLGLGLTITQRAVAAHGGEVTVRNLPGKGCVFTIQQPLEPRPEA